MEKSKGEIETRKRCFMRGIFGDDPKSRTHYNFAWAAWSDMSVGRNSFFYNPDSPPADRYELREFGQGQVQKIAEQISKGDSTSFAPPKTRRWTCSPSGA